MSAPDARIVLLSTSDVLQGSRDNYERETHA